MEGFPETIDAAIMIVLHLSRNLQFLQDKMYHTLKPFMHNKKCPMLSFR
ncbi:hypothetical protein [Flavobacterium sp. Root420]